MAGLSALIEARKSRWVDFLSLKGNTKTLFIINHNSNKPDKPKWWPDKKKERIEWSWVMYNKYMEDMDWLKDDRVPGLHMNTGTEIFAEAFGCSVHRPDNAMPHALPLVKNASEAAKLKVPDMWSTNLAVLFDIADELKRRAGKDAILKIPDIQSPMDISALIWDKNDFYAAMILEPEAVKELALKVRHLLTEFMDEWFRRYGREFIAHWPYYYLNEGITLSEDEAGIVNSDMFNDLFLPELRELSEHFNGIGMHCCAYAQHQWGNFKRIPGLRLLNLGGQKPETFKAAFEFFADHVPQFHGWTGAGPAWTWREQFSSKAYAVLEIEAASKDEALELSENMCIALGRD